jgi:hypothetical protein
MSWETFDDECPGCRPAMAKVKLDKDGKPFKDKNGNFVPDGVVPDTDPMMVAILKVWDKTTLEERRAYHRVTCQNSRDCTDMEIFMGLSERINAAVGGTNPVELAGIAAPERN